MALVASFDASLPRPAISPRLASARRDAIVLAVLITAVLLLIWNGSTFFHNVLLTSDFGPGERVTSTALTLNVAPILFGWRRYVDLQLLHQPPRQARQCGDHPRGHCAGQLAVAAGVRAAAARALNARPGLGEPGRASAIAS